MARTRAIDNTVGSSDSSTQNNTAPDAASLGVLASLGFSGHAPRGLWQGGRTLAIGIEHNLAWAKRHDVKLAFDCDALSLAALACDSPDVIGDLVEMIVEGRVELVGGAYSSINGLLAGGEANIRNHLMGAQTLLRLACSPATTFWQRHFSAFPQMPQLLANCGIDGAVLVHGGPESTPDVPREDEAIVAWSGADGTIMRTLSKTASTPNIPTKLGQAVQNARDSGALAKAVLAWLPCRGGDKSDRLREEVQTQLSDLAGTDVRLHLPHMILGAMWQSLQSTQRLQTRCYKSENLWHGQSLAVNGDRILRACARLERDILAIESLSALQPFLGKRDAWGEYPHWEIEEAWRGLLSAQHNEVREREGSFGGIAIADATRAQSLVDDVRGRIEKRLARRSPCDREGSIVINPLGWAREFRLDGGSTETVPAFGWLALPSNSTEEIARNRAERLRLAPEDDHLILSAAGLRIKLHRKRGVITQIFSEDFPQGMLDAKQELLAFELRNDDGLERFEDSVEVRSDIFGVKIERRGKRGSLDIRLEVLPNPSRIVLHVDAKDLPRPGCRPECDDEYGEGSGASWTRDGLQMKLAVKVGANVERVHDTPYCIDTVDPRGTRKRRYPGPGGSAPVEEQIRAPFTAASFVDLVEPGSGRGLLYTHDGGQGFTAERDGARALLSMWDPNIGGPWIGELKTSFELIPHSTITHEVRAKLAAEHRSQLRVIEGAPGDGQLPDRFSGIHLEGEHAQLTAFYRENSNTFEGPDIIEGCPEPWVARIVELDGVGSVVRLVFPNPVGQAFRCSASGEAAEELPIDPHSRNAVLVELRPREVATVRFRLA